MVAGGLKNQLQIDVSDGSLLMFLLSRNNFRCSQRDRPEQAGFQQA